MKLSEENELRKALINFFKGDSLYTNKGKKLSEFLITRSHKALLLFPKITKKEESIFENYLEWLDLNDLVKLYNNGMALFCQRTDAIN